VSVNRRDSEGAAPLPAVRLCRVHRRCGRWRRRRDAGTLWTADAIRQTLAAAHGPRQPDARTIGPACERRLAAVRQPDAYTIVTVCE
jgi:hypothetical protein